MKLRRSTIMMNRRLQLLVAGCALLLLVSVANLKAQAPRPSYTPPPQDSDAGPERFVGNWFGGSAHLDVQALMVLNVSRTATGRLEANWGSMDYVCRINVEQQGLKLKFNFLCNGDPAPVELTMNPGGKSMQGTSPYGPMLFNRMPVPRVPSQVQDVASTLGQAASNKLRFSDQDIQRMANWTSPDWTSPTPAKRVKEEIGHCNDSRYRKQAYDDVYADAGQECLAAGALGEMALGPAHPQVELAYQRACALPNILNQRETSPCAELGNLYVKQGDLDTALSVYLYALDHRVPDREFVNGTLASANGYKCLQWAAELLRLLHDYAQEREVRRQVCSRFNSVPDCERFKALGGDVNVDAFVGAANLQKQQAEAREQQDREDRAERHRESEARFNAVMGALQSMPGGSDPNAVVNAGNQQAAATRAVGDANTAQQQAAAQKAAQQAAASGSSGGTSSPATETCPSMQAFPDMGALCNPVRSLNQCVKVVSSTWTGNASTQNFGLLTVVFANICSQAIRLRATGPDNGLGQLQMVGPAQQFTYTESQHGSKYHYSADDGTDCFVNANRPGCGSN